MIRRCCRRICMSLVSVVTPGRSRSTFAICAPPPTRSAGRRHGFGGTSAAASWHPGGTPRLPPSSRLSRGDVRKTSVCIRSCPRGLARDSRDVGGGGYIQANANLWVNHQTVKDNNPSTQSTQTGASRLRKGGILSSFLSPWL